MKGTDEFTQRKEPEEDMNQKKETPAVAKLRLLSEWKREWMRKGVCNGA